MITLESSNGVLLSKVSVTSPPVSTEPAITAGQSVQISMDIMDSQELSI